MPELPEVETVVRGLALCVIGQEITDIAVRLPRIAEPSPEILRVAVVGRTITSSTRRAKYIVLELDSKTRILVHLRMTGRLIFVPPGAAHDVESEIPPATHITLEFKSGAKLHFADTRTFGRMRVVAPDEVWDEKLGIEPLAEAFTVKHLAGLLTNRRGPIKNVLLDQHLIAGIGNIYACEALWQSKIAPETPSNKLTRQQVQRLHAALQDVLLRAIDMRGTSARNYVDAEGLKGGFQNVLTVYGRHGEPCERCGKEILRTVIAQRGTWWCKNCQR